MKFISKFLKISFLIFLLIMLHSSFLGISEDLIDDFNFNKSINLITIAMKNKETKPVIVLKNNEAVTSNKGTNFAVKNRYNGDLTGYSADCPLCNGKLACNSSYNVYKNGVVTYPDKTFGNVRIVASSKSLACGSIVRFNVSKISSQPIYAIVLDRGVRGTDLDLLVANEKEAYNDVGRVKINYDVLRYGW